PHRAIAVSSLLLSAGVCAAPARAAGPPPTPATLPSAPVPSPADDPLLIPPPPAPRTIASWDEALSLIRAQSPDYRSSEEAVRRAAGQREIALAAVLPVVQAQGGYTHQLLSPIHATLAGLTGPATATPVPIVAFPVVAPSENALTATGSVSWSAINPRGIYGIGTADRAIDVARLTFEDRRRQIAAAAVDAMLAALAAARVAELDRVGLRAALDRLVLTRTRLQFGQGTELDVDRAMQDAAAARSAIVTGDESLRRSREALGVLLGSSIAMAPPQDADLESFETAVARTCRLNEDLERRPDVAAARLRVEVAERGVHDAELMFAPSLVLSSAVQYSSAPVLSPNTTWSVSGLVNVPLYDGGVRYGALKDSRAALEQARQSLTSTRLAAVVASAQARRAVGVLEHTRDVAREQRDLAARIDGRIRDGYAHGLGTSLDLVLSAQALRQADINLAILEFQVDDARANAALADAECVY
ncbi:MAG TPA: TolC family protein, partial [Polyangiaceae bacterium]